MEEEGRRWGTVRFAREERSTSHQSCFFLSCCERTVPGIVSSLCALLLLFNKGGERRGKGGKQVKEAKETRILALMKTPEREKKESGAH